MEEGALDQIAEEHAQAGVEGPDCLSPGSLRLLEQSLEDHMEIERRA